MERPVKCNGSQFYVNADFTLRTSSHHMPFSAFFFFLASKINGYMISSGIIHTSMVSSRNKSRTCCIFPALDRGKTRQNRTKMHRSVVCFCGVKQP